jgi:hypothetical protein
MVFSAAISTIKTNLRPSLIELRKSMEAERTRAHAERVFEAA